MNNEMKQADQQDQKNADIEEEKSNLYALIAVQIICVRWLIVFMI